MYVVVILCLPGVYTEYMTSECIDKPKGLLIHECILYTLQVDIG